MTRPQICRNQEWGLRAGMFGFDGQHRTLSQSLQEGTGFEPWVWYYQPAPKGKPASKAYKEVFRFNENVHTGKHHAVPFVSRLPRYSRNCWSY